MRLTRVISRVKVSARGGDMFALAEPGWFHMLGMRLGSPGTSGVANRGWKVRGMRPSRGLVELTVNSRAICTLTHSLTHSLVF